jgi:hypothetical protein
MRRKGFIITFILFLGIVTTFPVDAREINMEKPSYSYAANDPTPIEITAYRNRIKVENAPIGSVLEIYSVVGIKVKEIQMKQSSGEYIVNIAKGYYIIRIADTVRKVAIR